MRVFIRCDISHTVTDCDPATSHAIDLSMARFHEELEAVLAQYFETAHPGVDFQIVDEEEAR
jgi:hypothetical protein